jgi:MSHA biogenesis protein MshJ
VKRLWQKYAERINAATLRERVMIFTAAAAAATALASVALIDPVLARAKRFEREITERQASRQAIIQSQLELAVRSRQIDPDAESRNRLAELTQRIAKLNAEIATEQRRMTSPDRMREVLEKMLARKTALRLVDMKTLPLVALNEAAEGRRIYRHGIELSIAGGYLDLLAYVRSLEEQSTQIYWGAAELNASAYPEVELRVTVYTLSFEKSWMQV